MTQFEVMINLAGIKTKEGEDFVKVIKEIRVPGDIHWRNLFDIHLENGSVCFVGFLSVDTMPVRHQIYLTIKFTTLIRSAWISSGLSLEE